MSATPITTNLNKTLNIKVNLFFKLTLNLILMVNNLSETINLLFTKAIYLNIGIDVNLS